MVIKSQHSKYNLSWVRYLLPTRINQMSESIGVYKWLGLIYRK